MHMRWLVRDSADTSAYCGTFSTAHCCVSHNALLFAGIVHTIRHCKYYCTAKHAHVRIFHIRRTDYSAEIIAYCDSTRRQYSPRFSMSSACVPRSTICP